MPMVFFSAETPSFADCLALQAALSSGVSYDLAAFCVSYVLPRRDDHRGKSDQLGGKQPAWSGVDKRGSGETLHRGISSGASVVCYGETTAATGF